VHQKEGTVASTKQRVIFDTLC